MGDDAPIPLPQRPELRAVSDAPDQRQTIELYAAVIADIGERLSSIYEVFRAAAATDPAINAQWKRIQAERLRGAQGLVTILGRKGPLRHNLDLDEAADVVWVHIDASLYHRLVADRGWTSAQFQAWFIQSLESYLLLSNTEKPHRDPGRTNPERVARGRRSQPDPAS